MLKELPKIGKLQILEFSHKNKWGNVYLKSQCDCGNISITDFSSLNIGKTLSCGCHQREKVKETGLKNRKYCVNIDRLIDNSETAYIAGLLGADGYKCKSGIGISLVESDSYLLLEIINYLEFNGKLMFVNKSKINPNWQDAYRFTISDADFIKFFNDRGIITNKTYAYIIPEMYQYNSDFWRGMIDGDGCLFNYKYKTTNKKYTYKYVGIGLIGTLNCIEKFKQYCEFICNKKLNIKIYKNKKCKDIYTFHLVGIKAVPVLDSLYGNLTNNMYLKRKYEKYKEITTDLK